MSSLIKFKKFLGRVIGKYKFIRFPYLFVKSLIQNGLSSTVYKVIKKFKSKSIKDTMLYKEMFCDSITIQEQRNTNFAKMPLISILVPMYNTPPRFLKDMINSVIDQTYHNWELILVDASEVSLENQIAEWIDARLIYIRLAHNEGIVGNTNEAYRRAKGEYIGLLDHDDMLNNQCLFKVVEQINKGADFIYTDEITFKLDPKKDCYQPNLKPDFAPDTLRSYNYICHFSCFKKDLLLNCESLLNLEMEGSQDYDLILRLTERASHISHIPSVLYYWRAHETSTALSVQAKPYVIDAAKHALINHLERVRLNGVVLDGIIPTTYKINYKINGSPLVSILIPTSDHNDDLHTCIESIFEKSTYSNYEIILIENNSKEESTFAYYENIVDERIRVVFYDGEFNYSKINNFAVQFAKGDYLLLLNNDIEIITPSWIEEMLMYAQRSDVGCVGAKLLYSDNTIQHAGVIVGIGSVAGHSHKYFHKDDYGFMSRIQIVQNLSAVTAACMMIRKEVFVKLNGFDENFGVAFNDVDLCLRVRELEYLNIYTPYTELYHYESKSRGQEDSEDKIKRFNIEIEQFENKWGLWTNDPYYNVNLSMTNERFDLKVINEQ